MYENVTDTSDTMSLGCLTWRAWKAKFLLLSFALYIWLWNFHCNIHNAIEDPVELIFKVKEIIKTSFRW